MFGLRACNVLSGILRMVTRWLRPHSGLLAPFPIIVIVSVIFRSLREIVSLVMRVIKVDVWIRI